MLICLHHHPHQLVQMYLEETGKADGKPALMHIAFCPSIHTPTAKSQWPEQVQLTTTCRIYAAICHGGRAHNAGASDACSCCRHHAGRAGYTAPIAGAAARPGAAGCRGTSYPQVIE